LRSNEQFDQWIVINNLAGASDLDSITAKDKAALIGELLIAQKATLDHGEYLPWIAENCEFTDRRARNYIKVADVKRTRGSDFNQCTSIREVLILGKAPKVTPKETATHAKT